PFCPPDLPASPPCSLSLPDALPIFDAIGTVTSSGTVTVRPRVDGLLESADFQDGQTVRAGDVLARIDPEPFRIQLDQAQGQQAQDRKSTRLNSSHVKISYAVFCLKK